MTETAKSGYKELSFSPPQRIFAKHQCRKCKEIFFETKNNPEEKTKCAFCGSSDLKILDQIGFAIS